MKTLTFSHLKQPILTFEADEAELARDGEALLVQAQGRISFQDTPLLEELMHIAPSCYFTVKEADEELLHGHYTTTFLVLEPESLVVRIAVGK